MTFEADGDLTASGVPTGAFDPDWDAADPIDWDDTTDATGEWTRVDSDRVQLELQPGDSPAFATFARLTYEDDHPVIELILNQDTGTTFTFERPN